MRTTPPIPSALSQLDDATEWLNSEPLTATGLAGKVVAVQFCTYSCVNWIRTLPYVRAWVSAYRDRGLVVVGAHAPEFAFERELEGVRRALEQMGVEHPIVLDNEYAVWRSFDNQYWPALYLVDGEGRPRYHHFGEGAYVETEAAIRELLGADGEPVRVEATGIEAPADWDTLRSPETYLGYAQGERRLGDGDGPENLALNQWVLAGEWTIGRENVVLDEGGGSIAYRFHARDGNLVLSPGARDPIPFRVLLDGEAPGPSHGLDVDEDGNGLLLDRRLYQLVREHDTVRDRTLEITFLEPGAEAYVFTFG